MSPETREIAIARRRQGCGLPAGRDLLDLMLRIDARPALTVACWTRTIPTMTETTDQIPGQPEAATTTQPETVLPDGFAPELHIGDAELLVHAEILARAMAGDAAALRELPFHLRLYHTAIVEALAWRRMLRASKGGKTDPASREIEKQVGKRKT